MSRQASRRADTAARDALALRLAADEAEQDAVRVGRVEGVPWRVLADWLDVPEATLRRRYGGYEAVEFLRDSDPDPGVERTRPVSSVDRAAAPGRRGRR